MQFGVHHYARRKHTPSSAEENVGHNIINVAAYVAGILGPLLSIDQVEKVWVQKNASGVSAIAWGSNCLFSLVWTIYGIVHKEQTIIVTNGLWMMINGLVAVGTLLYG
jgi:uncharacterized protein with PQ loop repeat